MVGEYDYMEMISEDIHHVVNACIVYMSFRLITYRGEREVPRGEGEGTRAPTRPLVVVAVGIMAPSRIFIEKNTQYNRFLFPRRGDESPHVAHSSLPPSHVRRGVGRLLLPE